MDKTVFFVSDLHLGLESGEKEKIKENKFVEFLNFAKSECDELFIVGDLFDYWFEYRRVIQKGYHRTFSALESLTDNGIPVHYIIGNHDFMHRDFFESELGVKVYGSTIKTQINGKRFFIDHGDDFVANDFGYKVLKKVLRNKLAQGLYSLIHPDLGIWLAGLTSKTSREHTGTKDYGEEDSLFAAAKKIIDDGYDYVVFGHTHRIKYIAYKNAFYVNLGAWLFEPVYGKFSGEVFEIIKWK